MAGGRIKPGTGGSRRPAKHGRPRVARHPFSTFSKPDRQDAPTLANCFGNMAKYPRPEDHPGWGAAPRARFTRTRSPVLVSRPYRAAPMPEGIPGTGMREGSSLRRAPERR